LLPSGEQENMKLGSLGSFPTMLTMKETNDEVKELINTMPPKEITELCQHAVEKASILDIKLQGINRLANGIRIRYAIEEQVE
jgi:hypothetical protein